MIRLPNYIWVAASSVLEVSWVASAGFNGSQPFYGVRVVTKSRTYEFKCEDEQSAKAEALGIARQFEKQPEARP
jgi:hypothetical protein